MAEAKSPIESKSPFMGVKMKTSVSLQNNNLIAGPSSLGFVHKNELHFVEAKVANLEKEKLSEDLKCSYAEKDPILAFRWISTKDMETVLVLVTNGGLIHVYDAKGEKLLHSHKLQKSQVALSAIEAHLSSIAVVSVEADGSAFVVGSGSGELLLFHLNKSRLLLLAKQEAHLCLVTDLDSELQSQQQAQFIQPTSTPSSTTNLFASGDEDGKLILWKYEKQQLTKVKEFPSFGSSVTSIRFGHGFMVVAFASGHIRIFDCSKQQILVEITAHTRTITALLIHPSKPMFLAVSEDTHCSAWTLPTSGKIQNVAMKQIVSGLLTGVSLMNENGKEVVVISCYDSRHLFVMPLPN